MGELWYMHLISIYPCKFFMKTDIEFDSSYYHNFIHIPHYYTKLETQVDIKLLRQLLKDIKLGKIMSMDRTKIAKVV